MANTGKYYRIMLAIDNVATWYQCPTRLKLPLAVEAEVERWDISTAGVDWIYGEVDYLDLPCYPDMMQDPEMYIRQTEEGVEDWRAQQNWYPRDEPVSLNA